MKTISLIIAVLAVSAAAFFLYPAKRAETHAASPATPPPPPQAGVVVVKPEEVTIVQELNGRVTPSLIAEVRPQVNGIILQRLFEEGSDVTKEMPLYQIDSSMYDAELNRAQATLAKARANVSVAEAKLARYVKLLEAKAVNKQEYDEVEAASKQADADVGIALAQVGIARINVDHARVRSPIGGRIGKSSVTVGALVTASQAEPLAVVQQLDPIYVDVTQPISAMLELQDNMQAGILQNTGESYAEMQVVLENGQVYAERGKLLFADITVDQTTGSITLRAQFPNPKHTLLPGMYVRALLDVAQKHDAITVPQRALMREIDGAAYVYVATADNAVEKRPVATVRTVGDKWLIREGLRAGDRVVVDGFQRIRIVPGAPAPKITPVTVEK